TQLIEDEFSVFFFLFLLHRPLHEKDRIHPEAQFVWFMRGTLVEPHTMHHLLVAALPASEKIEVVEYAEATALILEVVPAATAEANVMPTPASI
ncbi:hypothetical protein ACJX0J_027492, partial [Zea mays]